MRERYEPPNQYAWIVYAAGIMLLGGLAGYVLSVQAGRGPAPAAVPTAAVASAPAPLVESELGAYRDILARDPNNAQAAVSAGNLLYDARRYAEAIPFYQKAFALLPTDINVSTDLGTALWYAGRPDEALAQYEKSLAIDAAHGQTLFNLGVVRADGKRDYKGAVAAWEQLLKSRPDYPDASKVRALIAEAKSKA